MFVILFMLEHKSFEQSLMENDFKFFRKFNRKELPYGIGNLIVDLVHSNIENYALLPFPLLLEGQRKLMNIHKDKSALYVKLTEKGVDERSKMKFSGGVININDSNTGGMHMIDLNKPIHWQIYMSKFSDKKSEVQSVPFEWHSEFMNRGYINIMQYGKRDLIDSTFNMLKLSTKYSEALSLPIEVMSAKDKSFGSRTNLFYFK